MKYRIRGTKGSFDNIDDLIDSFCKEKESCYGCVLGVHSSEGCRFWINSHKEEAIKLLDIEVEKPLEEYTLREIREHCKSINGKCGNEKCIFSEICCFHPVKWNFNKRTKWTPEEVKAAKAILELYRDASKIYYKEGLYCEVLYNNYETVLFKVPRCKFPSIKQGECVKISKILESENG